MALSTPIIKRFWDNVNVGEVYECWEWKRGTCSGGYAGMSINNTSFQMHRYSYIINRGPIPPRMEVMHACDNRRCVNPFHLSLGTTLDNQQDAAKKGRKPRGSNNAAAKLSEDDVREVRRLYAAGNASQRELARRFGVSQPAIRYAINGSTWGHIQ